MSSNTVSIAITGAGGAGVMTAGQSLLDAAAKAGWYGLMTRSSGPQIRGGEAAAFLRLSPRPVGCPDDRYDVLFAFDWMNVERFSAEIPLDEKSVIICDAAAGDAPEVMTKSGARLVSLPLKDTVKSIPGGRVNMIGLGILAALSGVPMKAVDAVVDDALARKGKEALAASKAGVQAGFEMAKAINVDEIALDASGGSEKGRWSISGNEAAGCGAIRGGVRFVAAYPITPATEILEWLAPNLEKVGGTLVQAEDELASVNMIIGGSFGGKPSLTATSGPGLALMTEAIGLSVASETPIVIVNVMRGGPSTGIPTKSEQSDLNIALNGLHGDAPHIVTAANSIADCLSTTQWTVHLSEKLQAAAIVLSDQSLGQSRAIIDKPVDSGLVAEREVVADGVKDYNRYAVTPSGVSPMAIPGTRGGEYVADGLEHSPLGRPSSAAGDHTIQLDKRERKLTQFDFGDRWADVDGDGDLVVITWGSSTAPAAEACERARAEGISTRMISLRLLTPAQASRLEGLLKGVKKILIVEQSHSKQFYRYLRAEYDLPHDAEVRVFKRPGPLPIRPGELLSEIRSWS
ncbi:MAG: 2-oxoacid:acceptor oxidoreductase subunit alpha [Rhodospirillales bacterium]|nr:2-oxoacid:acceptor oxidoreductase subunit alpha [Rhodospirillales bacterium]MCW8952612.1 2-oxoacid:acceptor oxidoreductase subunit alpha [Rhodospirillales bacterium]